MRSRVRLPREEGEGQGEKGSTGCKQQFDSATVELSYSRAGSLLLASFAVHSVELGLLVRTTVRGQARCRLKGLKAIHVARRGEHAPPIHNLVRLARGAGIQFDDQQTQALVTITAFHLESRYPDVKRSFRQRCTPEYTRQQMAAIGEVLGG